MSVISPWIFYAIDLLDKLWHTFVVVSVATPILFVLYWCFGNDNLYGEERKEFNKKMRKRVNKIIVVVSISIVGIVAIPSEETMYKMLVARYVTYENVDKASKTIKDGVDYIFKKLDKE